MQHSQSIKALIIDDEPLCIASLKADIEEFFPWVSIVGTGNSLKEAVYLIDTQDPDLVFLDIHLEDGNGTQLFQFFPSNYQPNFKLIFTTAFDQYAIKALRLGAIDYILKPISDSDIKEAMLRFQNSISPSPEQLEHLSKIQDKEVTEHIIISTQKETRVLNFEEIIYAEADSSYTNFILDNGSNFLASRTLKHYEEVLPEAIFVRVHDKYLVNVHKIKKYIHGRGGEILLANDTILKVSVRRKTTLLKQLPK